MRRQSPNDQAGRLARATGQDETLNQASVAAAMQFFTPGCGDSPPGRLRAQDLTATGCRRRDEVVELLRSRCR